MADGHERRVALVTAALVKACAPLWAELDAKDADMAAARVWVRRLADAHRTFVPAILNALDATLDPERPTPCVSCTPPFRETEDMVCQTCGTDYGEPSPFEGAMESLLSSGRAVFVDRPGHVPTDDDPLVVGDIVRVAYPVPPGVSNLGEVVIAEQGGHVVRVRFADRLHEHDARELLRLVRAERRRGRVT